MGSVPSAAGYVKFGRCGYGTESAGGGVTHYAGVRVSWLGLVLRRGFFRRVLCRRCSYRGGRGGSTISVICDRGDSFKSNRACSLATDRTDGRGIPVGYRTYLSGARQ